MSNLSSLFSPNDRTSNLFISLNPCHQFLNNDFKELDPPSSGFDNKSMKKGGMRGFFKLVFPLSFARKR